MKKAKVLYVCQGLYNGGTERVMLNYMYNIDRNRADIEVLYCASYDTYHLPMLERDGYVARTLGGDHNDRANLRAELDKFFKNYKYDIVHIHAITSRDILIAYHAKRSGCKAVIFHSHMSRQRCGWKLKLMRKGMSLMVNYKIACSRIAGEHMFGRKYNIFNNAIDVDNYRYSEDSRVEIRGKYGVGDDTLLIGNIGRLDDQKNHMYLLDIVSAMVAKAIDCKALIVGGGSREKELAARAIELNIADKVIFALDQPDAHKYYSAFDVLAFPSLYEGLSLVLVEAQANGLPIVYAELLTDEAKILDNVKLVPIGEENIDKWIDAIVSFNGKRITDTLKPLIERGFEIKSLASKIEQLYVDIANNKKLPKLK